MPLESVERSTTRLTNLACNFGRSTHWPRLEGFLDGRPHVPTNGGTERPL